jgi:hypothetical protein
MFASQPIRSASHVLVPAFFFALLADGRPQDCFVDCQTELELVNDCVFARVSHFLRSAII